MTDTPITAATALEFIALKERLHARISDIARRVHLFREQVWGYRLKRGAYDRFTRIPDIAGTIDSFEVYDGKLFAEFSWYAGDCDEDLTVSFPVGYLDLSDEQIDEIEQAAVTEAKRLFDDQEALLARKADAAKAWAEKRKAAKARETIPGFDDLPEETRAAIVAGMAN